MATEVRKNANGTITIEVSHVNCLHEVMPALAEFKRVHDFELIKKRLQDENTSLRERLATLELQLAAKADPVNDESATETQSK
jgi:hypothetical protein